MKLSKVINKRISTITPRAALRPGGLTAGNGPNIQLHTITYNYIPPLINCKCHAERSNILSLLVENRISYYINHYRNILYGHLHRAI